MTLLLRSLVCLAAEALLVCSAQAAPPVPVDVAVFDVHAAGGRGVGAGPLVKQMQQAGYRVTAISDLSPLTLVQYDVVWLFDVHSPGAVDEHWKEDLHDYIAAGGSVLQTWHHHILGEVGIGVRRVYDERRMTVEAGHPAVEGVSDFQARFEDHVVERVGKHATVLLRNPAGDAVAAAGTIGKGKVISTGLALGVQGSTSRLPVGQERVLMDAMLRWLKPDVPRQERLALLGEKPRMTVTPPERRVVAGAKAEFLVQFWSGDASAAWELLLDGQAVPVEPSGQESSLPGFTAMKITVPTLAGCDTDTAHPFVARCNGQQIAAEVRVLGCYAASSQNETRGVWLHVGTDRHPKDVMPELKRLGINLAVLRIAGGTAAFYASKVQPDVSDPLAEEGGDWLAEAVKHARANGVRLYPYVNNCVVEGRTSPDSMKRLQEQGRLQKDPTGETVGWFCPSHPDNLAAMAAPMLEIAANYDVDGIQYDFIRYPGPRGCFCETCRALFEKQSGKKVANWPEDVMKGGVRFDEYTEFRCERISRIVEYISTRIRQINPKIKIIAAVFRDWPACRVHNGQDWVRWCREGWLDEVFPMNYTQDSQEFSRLATVHREALPEGFPLIEGIGIRSGAGTMDDPQKLALHIVLARKAGAQGFCGFCYAPEHTTELFGALQPFFQAEPRDR